MKKIKYVLTMAAWILAVSCEKEIPTWSGADRISFETTAKTDTLRSYSFVFESGDITQHTIWINVDTEGLVRDYPRTVTLKQAPPADTGETAEPGVHFVAFDDPQVKAQYVIPAGAAGARLPIILLRDPSLQTTARTLRITLAENEHFSLSTAEIKLHRNIVFADKLTKPELWAPFFGTYGEAKHRFMIEVTDQLFDDKWFKENIYDDLDSDYIIFLRDWLQKKLEERNNREGNTLTEKDGAVVDFIN